VSEHAQALDDLLARIEAGDPPPIPESLREAVRRAAEAGDGTIDVEAIARFITDGPGGP